MLLMSAAVHEQIRRHAAAEYPRECCGVLLGDNSAPTGITVHRALPAANSAAPGTLHNRYVIDPLAILQADKTARAENLDIVGFYHSHPDHPAVPSQTDLSLAWPDYVYVIAAISADADAGLRAWRLTPAQEMQEIPIAESPLAP